MLHEITNFLKLACIARSQSNPWNSFLSLAINTFSCCHFLFFWNYFINILFALWRMCVSDEMEAITRRRVGRPKLPGSLKSIRLRESVFKFICGRIEKKLWDFQNAQTVSLQCKMRLTSLHDFYGSWPLYISRSLFGHSTFFVASPACNVIFELQLR